MWDFECQVIRQEVLGAGYRTLELDVGEEWTRAAQPGQFVHLRLPNLEASALRRPFSIYSAKAGCLRLLYKTVGRGTESMNTLAAGDRVKVMGPIGRGFPAVRSGLPILVAGGYGVAPLSFLAERIPEKGIAMIGGRTASDILSRETFEALGWQVEVATQDGSLGTEGLVTVVLDRILDDLSSRGQAAELFSCGPDGLLRAVGDRAISRGVKAWLSLDKHMVCGIGACLACVQKLRRADGSEWIGRACVDGPIFESREIVW